MRTKAQNKRMALIGTAGCLVLTAAVWWFMPPKPTGCAQHRDCPPTARRCYVGPEVPGGVCARPCEADADCAGGCCRDTAAGEGRVCAPAEAC